MYNTCVSKTTHVFLRQHMCFIYIEKMNEFNYSTSTAESLVAPTFPNDPSSTTFEDFIKWSATCQFTSNIALVTHTDNSSACLSQSPSFGPWFIDSDATDHIYLAIVAFSPLLLKLPIFFLLLLSMVHGRGIGFTQPFSTFDSMFLIALLIYCLLPD
ncbi:hypothetical protein PHAVU_003G261800 [Phaseolus vulgaris]|uniref:Uncharacterized protein n=1 Tax=Phaseolus vulgaris TaxID=3885 RepID=V7CDD7_PHAVU|nr:hypothetical protein PHAVU_003G261800g [Phaseolus vulgaris]ESW28134.1 hypothetical protein PHAVU_003G261800g [Phaseolus vulgaris]